MKIELLQRVQVLTNLSYSFVISTRCCANSKRAKYLTGSTNWDSKTGQVWSRTLMLLVFAKAPWLMNNVLLYQDCKVYDRAVHPPEGDGDLVLRMC